jgi:hypothetical protein
MSRIERIGPLEQLPAIPGEDKNLDGMPQCLHAA